MSTKLLLLKLKVWNVTIVTYGPLAPNSRMDPSSRSTLLMGHGGSCQEQVMKMMIFSVIIGKFLTNLTFEKVIKNSAKLFWHLGYKVQSLYFDEIFLSFWLFFSHYQFGQYGIYQLNVHDQNCSLEVIQDPSNPYFAILWAFFILGSLQISWIAGKSLYKNKIRPYLISRSVRYGSGLLGDDDEHDAEEAETEQERSKRKRRVKSLDAFRGLAIVIMIFVNYGGGGYSFFAQ